MAWAAALSRVGNINKLTIVLLVGGTCVYADVCVCALYTKAELRKDKALIVVSSGLAFLPPSKEALNSSQTGSVFSCIRKACKHILQASRWCCYAVGEG